ncbi:MAG TPA: ABC transporter ATP-binding protein [Syntrophorhabdaceae bacterium]|nr:ABC transporter ATP-binding protein [Syntrophorhabdaceae bacterium]HPU30013.1 ABC transporter ATP-binding protein [Syntrophorhabdaceae bacterium]
MNRRVVVLKNVSKSYPLYHQMMGIKNFLFNLPKGIRSMKNSRIEVLKDISFEIEKGESLGIIGKNGAGKSTILGLIAGVLKPTKGTVFVEGRVSPLLELGAGFHPDLTGRENILLNGILMGYSKAEILKKMDNIIAFTEIREFIDQPVRVYSSGMLARLGFSVVANLDPEILLIDEVLAVGDMDFQKKCIDKMEEFKRNGVTIVFVSHSMDNVKRICDRVIWIEDHSIKMNNDVNTVISNYTRMR